MPKFKVLAPVEHDQKLYLPKGATVGTKVKSVGNGQDIAVDSSGVIELEDTQAKALGNGQIVPVSVPDEVRTDSKRARR